MAFEQFPKYRQGIQLLQRSLERGRLGHAYLFTGHSIDDLEELARTLAKTLNCQNPVRRGGAAIDCCDQCAICRKIETANHGDIHWVRPESKSRIIPVDQMRELIREVQLKPGEAEFKVGVIVSADRLKTEGANAFLKTLEEPPPNSILVLLTTEPQRLLETIVSRCLRLSFSGEGQREWDSAQRELLTAFSEIAAPGQKGLLARYRLLDVLLGRLTALKEKIEETLTARSPLETHKDAEKGLREKWEDELKAAIEAEYRKQRAGLLLAMQYWLRDVWLQTLARDQANRGAGKTEDAAMTELLNFPSLPGAAKVAARISPRQAIENLSTLEQLQRWLFTNVQEALALEIGLLKLHL